jgi:hypothetical protein
MNANGRIDGGEMNHDDTNVQEALFAASERRDVHTEQHLTYPFSAAAAPSIWSSQWMASSNSLLGGMAMQGGNQPSWPTVPTASPYAHPSHLSGPSSFYSSHVGGAPLLPSQFYHPPSAAVAATSASTAGLFAHHQPELPPSVDAAGIAAAE